jgi:hypothetical protein
MIGGNGDIAERSGHDNPADALDGRDDTQPTATPGSGHRPSDAPSAEQVTDAWLAADRTTQNRPQRGDMCGACRVGTKKTAKVGANGSAEEEKLPDLNLVADPTSPAKHKVFVWREDRPLAENYSRLGKRLAASGDLYRSPVYGGGLLQVLPNEKHRVVTSGLELAPVIVDRVPVWVVKEGKKVGRRIGISDLSTMLRSENFLRHFRPADQITRTPLYLPDFTLTELGYNDGGPGYRVLYTGGKPEIASDLDTINRFLDVMEWESNADRTNAVAAALTVMLRNHFPGGKPIFCVTANKSHAGKDTVIAFATGDSASVSVSYQPTNWAFERSVVGAIKTNPDAAVIVVENARLDRRERFIASAFLERIATDPEPFLFSTGTGAPMRMRNDLVLAISTNFGTVSEDIMNRGLPSRVKAVGDVARRQSPIGNPRYEYLPANRARIAAELRGMVERWKAAGKPLDEDVRHPFSQWAKVIGGILKVNGFTDFLANYSMRKTSDDPIREAIGLLGAYKLSPENTKYKREWLRAGEWAELVSDLGLVRTLIPERDRENADSQTRAIGMVLSIHKQETFTAEDESRLLTLQLEKSRHRQDGDEAKVYYRFKLLGIEQLPAEDVSGAAAAEAAAPDDAAGSSQEGEPRQP